MKIIKLPLGDIEAKALKRCLLGKVINEIEVAILQNIAMRIMNIEAFKGYDLKEDKDPDTPDESLPSAMDG